jgi:hypothetical protein
MLHDSETVFDVLIWFLTEDFNFKKLIEIEIFSEFSKVLFDSHIS